MNEVLEKVVRRMVVVEGERDAELEAVTSMWWADMVVAIIDATDLDRETVLLAIAQYVVGED